MKRMSSRSQLRQIKRQKGEAEGQGQQAKSKGRGLEGNERESKYKGEEELAKVVFCVSV